MVLKRRQAEDWLLYLVRLWRLFRGARHQRYARALLIAGVALLSPTAIDVALQVLQLIGFAVNDYMLSGSNSLLVTQIAGVGCILSGILVFVTFEWRSGKVACSDESAALLTAQSFASLIVDVMRMLYVVSDEAAYNANINRFGVFADIADNHLLDLRSQTARFAPVTPVELLKLGAEIERQCAWVLNQIRQRDDVTFDIERCFASMEQASKRTNDYCELAISELYAEVTDVIDRTTSKCAVTRTNAFRERLAWQNRLLSSGVVEQIQTIAHDALQDLGLYYFAIDHQILRDRQS